MAEADRPASALDAYREAIEHQSIALGGAPASAQYRLFLSNHHMNLGRLRARLGDGDAARRSLARARELRASLAQDHPAEGSFQSMLQQVEAEIRALQHDRAAGEIGSYDGRSRRAEPGIADGSRSPDG